MNEIELREYDRIINGVYAEWDLYYFLTGMHCLFFFMLWILAGKMVKLRTKGCSARSRQKFSFYENPFPTMK